MRSLWIPLVCLFLAGALQADDSIKLYNGGVVSGEIIDETDDDVTIRTKRGSIQVISRADIYSIERAANKREEFDRRKEALRRFDIDGHLELAAWAMDNDMVRDAEGLYRRVIELDPDQRAAREALGYRLYDEKWYSEEEYMAEVRGLVPFGDEWVTPEERGLREMGFVQNESGEWELPETAGGGYSYGGGDRVATGEDEGPGAGSGEGGNRPPRDVRPPRRERDPADLAWYDDHEAPPWAQAKVYESRYYRIKTNVKPEYAKRYMKMMDQFYVRFTEVFNLTPEDTTYKSEVWIYASQQEFMANTGMSQGVGGFYNTGTRRVTAYHGRFGNSGTTQEVLAHEATHQFQDKVIPFRNAPTWIIEGFAVFFESAEYDGEKVNIGTIPQDRLSHLKRGLQSGDYIRLADLIRTSQAAFTAYHYAHAWSFIYLMIYYGDKKMQKRNQAVFSELFYRTKQGYVTAEDVEELFGGREKFLEFEETWKEWVLDLPYDFDPND